MHLDFMKFIHIPTYTHACIQTQTDRQTDRQTHTHTDTHTRGQVSIPTIRNSDDP